MPLKLLDSTIDTIAILLNLLVFGIKVFISFFHFTSLFSMLILASQTKIRGTIANRSALILQYEEKAPSLQETSETLSCLEHLCDPVEYVEVHSHVARDDVGAK